jgi:hypothetical protein
MSQAPIWDATTVATLTPSPPSTAARQDRHIVDERPECASHARLSADWTSFATRDLHPRARSTASASR